MGVQRLEDLRAFQAAIEMKLAVYALVHDHRPAGDDARFRTQLFDAAASVEMNIAEGWRRHNAGEFSQFLRYSRASLEEAERWIRDGIARRHYSIADAQRALDLANTCGRLTMALWKSLQPFIKDKRKR